MPKNTTPSRPRRTLRVRGETSRPVRPPRSRRRRPRARRARHSAEISVAERRPTAGCLPGPGRTRRLRRRAPMASPNGTSSRASQDEIEQLVDVLKAVKAGDSGPAAAPPRRILSRAGELLNDVLQLNEHVSSELLRVAKIVGQEGKMTERASVGPARGRADGDERRELASSAISSRRRTRSRASSPRSRRGTSRRRCRSTSKVAQSAASSSASERRSTRWSIS